MLAEFLETAVQIADIGDGLDDGFAVNRQDQAQRGVRGRVLRTEVEGPEIVLGSTPSGGGDGVGQ